MMMQKPSMVNNAHHQGHPQAGQCPPPSQPPPIPAVIAGNAATPQQPSTSHLRTVLAKRIKFLQCQLQASPPLPSPSGPPGGKAARQLPCIEEAWNIPVSQEMATRQQNTLQRGSTPNVQRTTQSTAYAATNGSNGPTMTNGNVDKSHYLSPQDMLILQHFQNNVNNLTPQQRAMLVNLQNRHRFMVQHRAAQNAMQDDRPDGQKSPADLNGIHNPDKVNGCVKEEPTTPPKADTPDMKRENNVEPMEVDGESKEIKSESDATRTEGRSLRRSELSLLLRTEKESTTCRSFVDPFADVQLPSETLQRRVPEPSDLDATADEILANCKEAVANYGVPGMSVLNGYDGPPPQLPQMTSTTKDKQLQAPSVFLENKKQAFTLQLQQFCNSNAITVVRNLASVLKLDLGLFSTKCLAEANPDHPVEIRSQLHQGLEENWDNQQRTQVWRCDSVKGRSTISRYAQYQAASFQEQLRDEQQGSTTNHQAPQSDSDSNSSLGVFAASKSKKAKKTPIFKTLKFGSHVDLDDNKRWKPQLQELQKLPPFTKVVSGCNMLSHAGCQIIGVNTVKLHLKVPGSRTTGHQEHNNFCSVNMNIGPGDCEWFATPYECWGEIYRICERAHVKYHTDSWWPVLEDLANHHIPVYRFTQRPGDLVYVNYGTVHWVYSVGWCNNISWNVGPLCADQFSLAVERYEWNKLHSIKSMVAMQRLTWTLAKNVRLADEKLFALVRRVLQQSLRHIGMLREWLHTISKAFRPLPLGKCNVNYYCVNCQAEVFNILFTKSKSSEGEGLGVVSKKFDVFCFHCARAASGSLHEIVVFEEIKIDDLKSIYDNFQLREAIPPPTTPSVT